MKKFFLIFFILLILIATSFFMFRQYLTKQLLKKSLSQENSQVSFENKAGESFLETYGQKDFNGTNLTIDKTLSENEFYTRYLVHYTSGDATVTGAMNVPQGTGPFPVVFMNHGWADPKLYAQGKGFEREQDFFARHGYVTFFSDYRQVDWNANFNPKKINDLLGYFDDVINAVQAVKDSDLPYFNKQRLGMLGHSMGGGLTLNVAVMQPDMVQAVALFAPISADQRDNYQRWIKQRPEIAKAINFILGQPQDNEDFWKSISASDHLDQIQAPIMISHGAKDNIVPFEWSEKLYNQLKQNHKEAYFYQYQKENHIFSTDWQLAMQRTLDFMNQKLKNS